MAAMNAAQLAVVVAALREDTPATTGAEGHPPKRDLRKQPRVNREVMLELARKKEPGVRDVSS